MKKITILALHLGYGGIERCITSLANTLCEDYNVEIVSNYKLGNQPSFQVNEKVEIKYLMDKLKPNHERLKKATSKKNPFKIIKEVVYGFMVLFFRRHSMIKFIRSCDSDYIISTRDIHNEWLGKYGNKNATLIGWEHNHHNNNKKYIEKVEASVKNLDYLVTVSSELQSFYADRLKNTSCRCVYIPNTIDYFPSEASKLTTKRIFSVGRLSPEKGYSDLISIFEKVHKKHKDWHLDIIGDGLEKEELIRKIDDLKLNDDVTLHGFQNREYINELIADSSINVMTSFTESFGIVILEGFAYGVPCVAFSSAQGATEIIESGKDGILIENRSLDEMAQAISTLIEDLNLRKKLGNQAREKAKSYLAENIKIKWIEILK